MTEGRGYWLRNRGDLPQKAAPPRQDWRRRDWGTKRDLRRTISETRGGSGSKPALRRGALSDKPNRQSSRSSICIKFTVKEGNANALLDTGANMRCIKANIIDINKICDLDSGVFQTLICNS
ncbi:hypothetical protein EVAR_16551_1 [Eumeta japonica]|uniref:Uncharacterized protein n=1 Tax=Eumeta variegata TaxID=151549 RepID=A0A4C1U337_EUMVA|nr:hypothetical protein EVAR_16551_1 [Eumeta japonica]